MRSRGPCFGSRSPGRSLPEAACLDLSLVLLPCHCCLHSSQTSTGILHPDKLMCPLFSLQKEGERRRGTERQKGKAKERQKHREEDMETHTQISLQKQAFSKTQGLLLTPDTMNLQLSDTSLPWQTWLIDYRVLYLQSLTCPTQRLGNDDHVFGRKHCRSRGVILPGKYLRFLPPGRRYPPWGQGSGLLERN